jgi:hypothetical protein
MGFGNGQHDYRTCRDPDCERYACRIWKEAWREAFSDGREEGYDVGFGDGMAACPRNHSGG